MKHWIVSFLCGTIAIYSAFFIEELIHVNRIVGFVVLLATLILGVIAITLPFRVQKNTPSLTALIMAGLLIIAPIISLLFNGLILIIYFIGK